MTDESIEHFRAAMRPAALALLGEPNAALSRGDEFRYGQHGSLAIDTALGRFYDHENEEGGNTLEFVMRQLRCDRAGAVRWLAQQGILPERQREQPKPQFGEIVARFDYLDENGERLFQVCKLNPPAPARFLQRHEVNGQWKWDTKGVRRVLYRLPDVLARDGSFIVVAEGEKDVDRLWANGIPATCNPGGAGKWLDSFNEALRGADVVILPDNDDAGRRHRDVVAQSVSKVAASVRVLYLPALKDKGDVSDWFDAGGTREDLLTLCDSARPWRTEPDKPRGLRATPFDPADVAKLQPRRWIYGSLCIRKYVSLIGAPGGVGKTAYTIAAALAIATGKPLLGEKVHEPGAVWLYNLEDDRDEMLRRVAAAMKFHGVSDAEIAGRIYIDSGRAQPLCIAGRDKDTLIASPQVDELIAELKERQICTLFVDPFVKSHRLEENRNEQIDFAASLWAKVADNANCSIPLVHHFKKGGVSGEGDAFRGASALVDAARSALSLQTMSEQEGDHFGLPPARRTRIIRLDNAKLNLAPRPDQAQWIELASVQIQTGDYIQVAHPFHAPSAWCGLNPDQCNDILDAIDRGRGGGVRWSASKRSADWVGPCVQAAAAQHGARLTDEQVLRILSLWMQSGALTTELYRNAKREQREGLKVNNSKRPGASGVG